MDCPPKVNTESEGACTNKKGLHTKYAPAFWFRVHACTHAAAYQLPKMLHPILQHLPIYSSKVSKHDQPFTSNNRWSSPTTTLPPNLFTPLKPGLSCSRSTSKLCLTIEQAGTHFYQLYLVSAGKPAYMVSKIWVQLWWEESCIPSTKECGGANVIPANDEVLFLDYRSVNNKTVITYKACRARG